MKSGIGHSFFRSFIVALAFAASIAVPISQRWLSTANGQSPVPTEPPPPSPISPASPTFASAIDTFIARDFEQLTSHRESDTLLLRRLSLDLRQVVPTADELDEFTSDIGNDRWPRWVKRFMADPLFDERLVDWLDKSWMQRRPNTNVDKAKWQSYLRESVDQRKSLDTIAKEMVSSVWWNASQRAQQRFFLDRGGDPHLITRDLARVYFGRDMQCAQCHDHPQIADYLQIDYHGLLAYVASSSLTEAKFKDEKGVEQKLQIYAEKASADAPFESVFDKGVLFRSGMRVPGSIEQTEAYQSPDQRYQSARAPDALDGSPPLPSVSRRDELAKQLTGNRAFAENWANRIWAMMMGRGLVHPLDMHHADNPPSHPQLLQALADSFSASGFDVRALIEQIALSQAYQRSIRLPIESALREAAVLELPADQLTAWIDSISAKEKKLTLERDQLNADVEAANKTMEDAESAWRAFQRERVAIRADLDKAEASFSEGKKQLDESTNGLAKATKARQDLDARTALLEEAIAKLGQAQSLGLADDGELKQAIATAKAKADASRASIPVADKAIADATSARDTRSAALEAERSKINEVVARLAPVEKSLADADQAYLMARNQWRQRRSEHILLVSKVAQINRITQWIDSSQSVSALEAKWSVATAESVQANQLCEQNAKERDALQMRFRSASESNAVTKSKLADAMLRMGVVSAEIAQLQSTLQSLAQSSTLVEPSDSLNATIQSLQTSVGTRATTLASMQSEAGEIEKLVAAQTAEMSLLEQNVAALETKNQELLAAAQLKKSNAESAMANVTSAKESCSAAIQRVIEDRQKDAHAAVLRSLSPEQMGWSILQATGVLANYVIAEKAELDKQSPLAADASSEQQLARNRQILRQAMDKLRPNVDVFSTLYSSGVGQTSDEFFASPDQALYMSNGGAVFQWAAPNGSNIASRVANQADPKVAIKSLYRALLSREPSDNESTWAADLLSAATEKNPIAQELVWGLLSSSEFRVYP